MPSGLAKVIGPVQSPEAKCVPRPNGPTLASSPLRWVWECA